MSCKIDGVDSWLLRDFLAQQAAICAMRCKSNNFLRAVKFWAHRIRRMIQKLRFFRSKRDWGKRRKACTLGGLSCQHPRRKEGAFPSVFVQLATNNVTFWQEFLPKPAVSQKINRFFAEYFVSCGMRFLILHQISGDSCTKISDSPIFSNMKIISCVRFE